MSSSAADRKRLAKLRAAVVELKRTTEGYRTAPTGIHWRRALARLDELERDLSAPAPPKVPALGPIVRGGAPLLEHDLTHRTDGLDAHGSVWPAFDDGIGRPGLVVIAPELVTITGHGRAVRRDGRPNGRSLDLAIGASGLEYWIGHLEQPAPVGSRVRKGARLGVISANHEAPHVHVAVNARPLLGRDLEHHTNYTHGAPRIGAQLRKGLA